jgi:hypothetical protein
MLLTEVMSRFSQKFVNFFYDAMKIRMFFADYMTESTNITKNPSQRGKYYALNLLKERNQSLFFSTFSVL